MDESIDKVLNATGLKCLGETLLCLPSGYAERRFAHTSLVGLPVGRRLLIKGTLVRYRGLDRKGEPTRSPYPACIEVVMDVSGFHLVTRLYGVSLDDLEPRNGMDLCLEGDYTVHPQFGPKLLGACLGQVTRRVDPLYTGVPGQFSGEVLSHVIAAALQDSESIAQAVAVLESNEVIAEALSRVNMGAQQLLLSLHKPLDVEKGIRALKIARRISIHEVKQAGKASAPADVEPQFNIDEDLIRLVGLQAETLSFDQRKALNMIRIKVNRGVARVLLNGDVGCGKTLVFLLACAAIAHASKRQVAIMAPSDLVARQIHAQALARFPDLNPLLLVGGSSRLQPDGLSGSQMLVGTQALLHLSVDLDLAALVIDEQHKFSVEQRQQLAGPTTHVIEATATPIPRTLALALFDGWVNATIEHAPVDKKINSHLIEASDRYVVTQLIRKHLDNQKKIIFLYPVVASGVNSVVERAKALDERFKGLVGVVHGKLKPQEKEAAIADFRSGKTPIIVASTAVEVGVDVPDVTLMVVNSADRFGVAQLHQLRGRLARNGGEADFVMHVQAEIKAQTRKRLEAVKDCSSGFELSERDLKLRGFGDVAGEMQSGKPLHTFKLVQLVPEDFLPKRQQPIAA